MDHVVLEFTTITRKMELGNNGFGQKGKQFMKIKYLLLNRTLINHNSQNKSFAPQQLNEKTSTAV
jgi:hypothetical protein